MQNPTTLKGVVAGATFNRYSTYERELLGTGKTHGEVLDAVVSAGLDALGGARASAKSTSRKKK